MDMAERTSREDLSEFQQLVSSTGIEPVEVITGSRQVPDPKTFIGRGKVEQLQQVVASTQAELVIFNHQLAPSQEKNIETAIQCRVLDRTGLILDIFAQRARTAEGKLQVELAQLQHLSTRLVRGWTHLERQKGGIGLRGPGETQLETDRRLLRGRIKTIHKRLAKVRHQRGQSRRARQRVAVPTVSLVGYTNAGKSCLFNRLTGSDAYIADQMFATLDPTIRRIHLPGAGNAVVADTVGFIRHLPHDLVEAFRATLEETRDANLLCHVIDLSDPRRRDNIEQVNSVLTEIEAEHVPQLKVYNKIDCVENCKPRIEYDAEGKPAKVWVSALTGEGSAELIKAIGEHLYGDPIYRTLCLGPQDAKLRAQLYEMDAVLKEHIDDSGQWLLAVRMSKVDFENLIADHLISSQELP